MAIHRRYQAKKSDKLGKKSKQRGNSFSTSKQLPDDLVNKKQLDEQPLSRSFRDIQEQIALQKAQRSQPPAVKKRKRIRNRFLAETLKLGYHQRPWEDNDRLVWRISRDQTSVVDAELLKARLGNAGRDPRKIADDYALLDEKEKQKAAQRVAHREKLRKLEEKALKFKRSAKSRGIGNTDDFESDDGATREVEGMEAEESYESEMDEEEGHADKVIGTLPAKKSKQRRANLKDNFASKEEGTKKSKLRGSKKRLKKRRDDKRQTVAENSIINAKETVPFGVRVDAPPMFTGKNRRIMEPLHSLAGKKDLLLKTLLPISTTNSH